MAMTSSPFAANPPPVGARFTIAALALIVVASFAGLAAADRSERLAADAARRSAVLRNAGADAAATLARHERLLVRLVDAAGSGDPTATAAPILAAAAALDPGLYAAAVLDAGGTVVARSPSRLDAAAFAAFAEAATSADAAEGLYRTAPRDGLVGLVRVCRDAEGKVLGFALAVVETAAVSAAPPPPADDTAAIEREWRAAWLRNGALVGGIGLVVALAAAALDRRRRRAAWRDAENRAREAAALQQNVADLTAAASRADEASRAKSRFFAQVTHELRTPLNAILGFSETIRREMFGPIANPRYVDYAGLIHDAGSHLLSLINDLLDLSKLEEGRMEIAPIRVSAAALARSTLDLVEMLARERNQTLAVAGVEPCPDLTVDPRAAKQVLVNLLSNAIKFTPVGGRIELRFAARADGAVVITVADNGAGMSPDDIRLAFEPFGRAHGELTARTPGTGLGLPIARALMRLHGGDLTLTSKPGAGTTATAVFPAETRAPAAVPAAAAA